MHTGRIQTATWAHLRVHKSKGYENGCFSWIISYTIASFLLPEFCHIFLSILLLGGEPYCDLVKCFALTHNKMTQSGFEPSPFNWESSMLFIWPLYFSLFHVTWPTQKANTHSYTAVSCPCSWYRIIILIHYYILPSHCF